MAKLTLDTITSSFASTTLFNTNFATILAELDGKVLYRNNTSGEANQMENDLDMNSNDILNANALNVTTLTVNGTPLTASTATTTTASAVTYDDSASVHTAVDVQEALDELGNASLATVQTSATDETAGRLMAVGAGGLLATAPALFNGDCDTLLSGSDTYIQSAATNTPPSESGNIGVLTVNVINSNTVIQTFRAINSRGVYVRTKDSTWSAWLRTDPQAFGIGTDVAPQLLDLQSLVSGGLYSVAGGSTNLPPNMSNGVAIVSKWLNGGTGESQSVIAHDLSNYAVWITSFDGYDQDTWQTWQPVYTGVNYQPDSIYGIGVVRRMLNTSGADIASTATIGGASISAIRTDTAGNVTSTPSNVGTWRNISGFVLPNNTAGEFHRVS